jgi:isopentenyldiphosphate isomerase
MDELVEIWDKSGKPTGKTAFKSRVHQAGWFHPTVHVWFYTFNGKVLLQKRAAEKDTFPGLWDVSVAGHMQAGETPLEAARREVKEEIGITVEPQALQFIGRLKSEHSHPGGMQDREFHHIYLSELRVPLHMLQAQEGEVSELELKRLLQFSEEVWGPGNPGRYVPHSREYYTTIIKAIKSRL